MKQCKKCGEELKERQKFCPKCGQKVDENQVKVSEDSPSMNEKQKRRGKRLIIIFSALFVIAITVFWGYRYAEEYYSRENQIERIIDVLKTGDYAQIASTVSTGSANFEVNEETIVPFVDTYVSEMDFDILRHALSEGHTFDNVFLMSEGMYFSIFDQYRLGLAPSRASISTNMSDVTIFVDDSELVTSDTEEFTYDYGPFVPGEYEFSAVTEVNGEEWSADQQVVTHSEPGGTFVDLSFYALYFSVASNVSDAKVFVNEEEIGQLENGEGYFGPFASLGNDSLHLEAEGEYGSDRTETVTMNGEEEAAYTLDFSERLTEEDAHNVLESMYQTLSSLTHTYSVASSSRIFETFFYEGVAFDELRPFFTGYAERQRENSDVRRVEFAIETSQFEQVAQDEYRVALEVDYRTIYPGLNREDRVRTFTYEVSLMSDEAVRNTRNNEREFYINGFANEELIYDSQED